MQKDLGNSHNIQPQPELQIDSNNINLNFRFSETQNIKSAQDNIMLLLALISFLSLS